MKVLYLCAARNEKNKERKGRAEKINKWFIEESAIIHTPVVWNGRGVGHTKTDESLFQYTPGKKTIIGPVTGFG